MSANDRIRRHRIERETRPDQPGRVCTGHADGIAQLRSRRARPGDLCPWCSRIVAEPFPGEDVSSWSPHCRCGCHRLPERCHVMQERKSQDFALNKREAQRERIAELEEQVAKARKAGNGRGKPALQVSRAAWMQANPVG
jgi:hypothetical protein